MQFFYYVIMAVQVFSAIAIIALVLVQHGKGADMGAAFGSGSSGSLFGASGSANFLSRTTGVLAALFFISTLALTYLESHRSNASAGLLDNAQPTVSVSHTKKPPVVQSPAAQPKQPMQDSVPK